MNEASGFELFLDERPDRSGPNDPPRGEDVRGVSDDDFDEDDAEDTEDSDEEEDEGTF